MEKILVIGDDLRSFLAIVRSLARAGYEVHAAPFDFSSPALASRFISAIHRLPRYAVAPEAWLQSLQSLIAQHHFALTIPCGDNHLMPLAHHQAALAAPIALPNEAAFQVFFDKEKTRELAARCGVPIARGGPVSAERVAELGLPFALKPRQSVHLRDVGHRGAVKIIRTPEEVASALLCAKPVHDYFVEAFFAGDGVGVSVLARQGEIVQAFQHRRLAETSEAGGSSSRVSEALDPAHMAAVTAMCAAVAYHGVAMFEFRHNPETRAFVLLEVNARFWGSLPLAIASGSDFPADLAKLLLTDTVQPPHANRTGIVRRHLTAEYYRILTQSEQAVGRFHRAAHLGSSLLKLALDVLARPRQFDSFAPDDLAPFRAERRRTIQSFMRSIGQALPERRQRLIRQSHARLKSALPPSPRTPRLMFICFGNICRSPFAARLLSARVGEAAVISSAGTLMLRDRPSPADAVACARTHEVSLDDHRSEIATYEALAATDAIFIFDDRNADDLAQLGVDPNKIIRLGSLIGRRMIDDPYGLGLDAFENCYAQIATAVDVIAAAVVAR